MYGLRHTSTNRLCTLNSSRTELLGTFAVIQFECFPDRFKLFNCCQKPKSFSKLLSVEHSVILREKKSTVYVIKTITTSGQDCHSHSEDIVLT